MSEIGAIYILQYLESCFEKIKTHHTRMYTNAIEYAGSNNVRLFPNYADLSKPIITSCICFLDDKFSDDYITAMITSGIICRKYYHPLANLPQATAIYSAIICYPCNLDINSFHLL